MKKVVLTLTASLACLAAFGQGRISFQTDSLHLVYYQNTPGYTNGEAVYAAPGHMPAGVTLMADLYLGTSSTSLSLISSTTFSTVSAGKWNTLNYQSPTISGGTTVFVVAQIRDAAFAAPSTWDSATAPFGTFYGASQEFSFVLGTSSLQYPQMYNHNASLGGGFSTWQDGTVNMDVSANLAGSRGAIAVSPVPEPASMALLGLGAAAMLILRRRK